MAQQNTIRKRTKTNEQHRRQQSKWIRGIKKEYREPETLLLLFSFGHFFSLLSVIIYAAKIVITF